MYGSGSKEAMVGGAAVLGPDEARRAGGKKKGKKEGKHVCCPGATTTRVWALVPPWLSLARSETSISGVFEVPGWSGRYRLKVGGGGVLEVGFTTILYFQGEAVQPRANRA